MGGDGAEGQGIIEAEREVVMNALQLAAYRSPWSGDRAGDPPIAMLDRGIYMGLSLNK